MCDGEDEWNGASGICTKIETETINKITRISCEIASTVASIARVPRVCSSSTAFTVFNSDETFKTINLKEKYNLIH